MDNIIFEVCYARSDRDIFHIAIKTRHSMTVIEALNYIDFFSCYPEIGLDKLSCGIFSKKVTLHYVIQNEDRLEIYRPLNISPIAARRLRATSSK
ncbi:MAG: RnfH family protein [Pseudomonadota bacterium]|nr:RnfH family protein [Pseudomonadota bacterium]